MELLKLGCLLFAVDALIMRFAIFLLNSRTDHKVLHRTNHVHFKYLCIWVSIYNNLIRPTTEMFNHLLAQTANEPITWQSLWRWLAGIQSRKRKGILSDYTFWNNWNKLMEFPHIVISQGNGPKNRKWVSCSCVEESTLLMWWFRGDWVDWLETMEKQLEVKSRSQGSWSIHLTYFKTLASLEPMELVLMGICARGHHWVK